jgi:hypothetical protein
MFQPFPEPGGHGADCAIPTGKLKTTVSMPVIALLIMAETGLWRLIRCFMGGNSFSSLCI